MNEQIQRLAEQAYFDIDFPTDVKIPREFVEKFAELIVKECADHIMTSSDRYRKEYFADKILKHFGVKNERTNSTTC